MDMDLATIMGINPATITRWEREGGNVPERYLPLVEAERQARKGDKKAIKAYLEKASEDLATRYPPPAAREEYPISSSILAKESLPPSDAELKLKQTINTNVFFQIKKRELVKKVLELCILLNEHTIQEYYNEKNKESCPEGVCQLVSDTLLNFITE